MPLRKRTKTEEQHDLSDLPSSGSEEFTFELSSDDSEEIGQNVNEVNVSNLIVNIDYNNVCDTDDELDESADEETHVNSRCSWYDWKKCRKTPGLKETTSMKYYSKNYASFITLNSRLIDRRGAYPRLNDADRFIKLISTCDWYQHRHQISHVICSLHEELSGKKSYGKYCYHVVEDLMESDEQVYCVEVMRCKAERIMTERLYGMMHVARNASVSLAVVRSISTEDFRYNVGDHREMTDDQLLACITQMLNDDTASTSTSFLPCFNVWQRWFGSCSDDVFHRDKFDRFDDSQRDRVFTKSSPEERRRYSAAVDQSPLDEKCRKPLNQMRVRATFADLCRDLGVTRQRERDVRYKIRYKKQQEKQTRKRTIANRQFVLDREVLVQARPTEERIPVDVLNFSDVDIVIISDDDDISDEPTVSTSSTTSLPATSSLLDDRNVFEFMRELKCSMKSHI